MEIIYRADDGREFDNEYECEAYENQQKLKSMNLQSRFFDEGGHLIPMEDLVYCVERAWYMEIATMEEARFLAEYAEREVGIVLFEDKPQVGRFYYTENEEWRPIEDLYQRYAKVNNIFERED
jgi:hypothetical protein